MPENDMNGAFRDFIKVYEQKGFNNLSDRELNTLATLSLNQLARVSDAVSSMPASIKADIIEHLDEKVEEMKEDKEQKTKRFVAAMAFLATFLSALVNGLFLILS